MRRFTSFLAPALRCMGQQTFNQRGTHQLSPMAREFKPASRWRYDPDMALEVVSATMRAAAMSPGIAAGWRRMSRMTRRHVNET
jgi:hypothetical protein